MDVDDGARAKAEGARDAATTTTRPPNAAADKAAAEIPAADAQPQQQQDLDRSLQVLFLVLERQRLAAREARALKRRRRLRFVLNTASAPPDADRAPDGCADDDGEDGAITGGGWKRESWGEHVAGPPPRATRSDTRPVYQSRRPPPPPRPGRDAVFIRACAVAARVCRGWRAVAAGAVDRAVFDFSDRRNNEFKGPERLRAALRDFDGGVLRALWACDSGGGWRDDAESLAIALVCTGGGETESERGPDDARDQAAAVARVLAGLRVLRLDRAAALQHGLGVVPLPSPPPSRPIFASLVTLRLGPFESRWAPPARRENGRFFLLSRLYFPLLRVLDVTLSCGAGQSDCPLQIAWGGGDDGRDPALLPPPLQRLRVVAAPRSRKDAAAQAWPAREPLLISSNALAALATSLPALDVDRPWCFAGAIPRGDEHAGDASAPRPAFDAAELLKRYARETSNARPQQRIAPMASLVPALSGLTALTGLKLSPDLHWMPGPVQMRKLPGGYNDPGREQQRLRRREAEGARASEWATAARALFAPLASSLLRLDITHRNYGTAVRLPPCLSLLSRLTGLDVVAGRIDAARPLPKLTRLRRLVLNSWEPLGESLWPSDLTPLSRLEFLNLGWADEALAPVIKNSLPRLTHLTLWERDHPDDDKPWRHAAVLPPASVLRAALKRLLRNGTAIFTMDAHDHSKHDLSQRGPSDPPLLVDAERLRSLIKVRTRTDYYDEYEDEDEEGNPKEQEEDWTQHDWGEGVKAPARLWGEQAEEEENDAPPEHAAQMEVDAGQLPPGGHAIDDEHAVVADDDWMRPRYSLDDEGFFEEDEDDEADAAAKRPLYNDGGVAMEVRDDADLEEVLAVACGKMGANDGNAYEYEYEYN